MKLAISIIVCLAAGGIGTIFTTPAIRSWYPGLAKPAFNPPNWLFGPAWTVLYILMGIAAGFVWQLNTDTPGVTAALIVFLIQLVLNILWSVVFFGYRSLTGGLIVIGLLWIAILITLLRFWGLDQTAGILLIPYLAWVSFAGLLNFEIRRLN